jgi:hypothetical protein
MYKRTVPYCTPAQFQYLKKHLLCFTYFVLERRACREPREVEQIHRGRDRDHEVKRVLGKKAKNYKNELLKV